MVRFFNSALPALVVFIQFFSLAPSSMASVTPLKDVLNEVPQAEKVADSEFSDATDENSDGGAEFSEVQESYGTVSTTRPGVYERQNNPEPSEESTSYSRPTYGRARQNHTLRSPRSQSKGVLLNAESYGEVDKISIMIRKNTGDPTHGFLYLSFDSRATGRTTRVWPVGLGMRWPDGTGGPTPIVTQVHPYWLDPKHKSEEFNGADMGWSIFFDGGIAIHRGNPYKPSHGCVHLRGDLAKSLFDLVEFNGKGRTFITVTEEPNTRLL